MSRVLFIGCPRSYGHTYPTLGLVAELVKNGETVLYLSTEEFRKPIQSVGAEFIGYPEQSDTYKSSKKQQEDFYLHFLNSCIHANYYYKHMENVVQYTVQRRKFEYVIFDESAPWGKSIARKWDVPAICSITKFAYCETIWKQYREILLNNVLQVPEIYLAKSGDVEEVIDKLQKCLKILKNKFEYGDGGWGSYFSNTADLNIVYTSREFQLHGEYDDSFKFIGPDITYRNNFAEESVGLDNRHLLYISMGTSDYNLDFIQLCVQAFGGTKYSVLISAGKQFKPACLKALPSNVTILNFVNQIEVLKHARLFISHGGMNSTNEALLYGVPLVVCPQRGDQFLVAKRIEELELGVNIHMKSLSPRILYEVADRITQNNKYIRIVKLLGGN